ncbi:two-component system sensor histidine kinase EvgS [Luteibacter jiangsuensis]|uniref:histidine kinase n=1 Tax=Luteibacter jiangsuensis TaxID=637577 RepID=A0ABT9T303_9GAMM|nr:transporter substrate-binding domain-containing protein [Luteibacter jiangsuensis]MDQ0011016.1 two-component system sensor histidine kinase EvgS [Luteibacter jiangsuensis]
MDGLAKHDEIALTDAERDWLAHLPVLRVGIDPTSAPLSLVDRGGAPVGLAMDYLDDALAALGVAHVPVRTQDWGETVRSATAGDIDILPAASPRNDELGRNFDFTEPYIEFPVMIVTRDDMATIAGPADLGGHRVAANLAQGAVANAVHHLPLVEPIEVRNAAEGLRAVASGQADAYVGDIATAEYFMRRDHPARLKLAAPTDERAELAIAVDRRYAPLIPLLDRALARISEHRTQAIRNTWLRSHYTWGGSWQEIARKAGPPGAAVLALLLAVSHAYMRLRRETRRRRSSEDRLADITRHIPAVFYRFRYFAGGRIEFIHVGGNPEPIFGVPADAFLHDERRAFARIDPRDQAPLLAEVARAANTLTPIHAEIRIRDVAPERWIASHALPRPVADAVEFTGYWIDISDRHEQAAQLADAKHVAEEATAAKSRFLATMSHEIRTPMHGLIGMLEMLGETSLQENQRHLLGTAESSAEALLRILDDVLDFSRIEAGAVETEHAAFDLRQLLDDIVALHARQTRKKGLSVDIHVDTRLAQGVMGDAARLRQVLLNLVSNAIKFTVQGGIDITVDVVEDMEMKQRVRIDVVDTGIGIAQEDIVRLFAPFRQAEPSTTRRFGGSGLGLAISRRLVELMGGDLIMSSEAGEGTRLSIVLDMERSRYDASDETAGAMAVAMPPAKETTLDVLVAEDNATNRQLVAAQLARLGHRYELVEDGAEALARASSRRFDVLLTDLHMPVMDGYALTRALRRQGSSLRIVALTANALPGEEARCRASGMDGFATKPLRLGELDMVLSPGKGNDSAHSPCDLDAWRETYGDLALLPLMVARFEMTVREDMAGFAALGDPSAAADWVHRILGGMRVFGPSAEAALAEDLENELRGIHGAAAMHRLPELASAIEDYASRLRATLDACQCTEDMLKN